MKLYDVTCPNCGHDNKNLLLEDSNGWMECEGCGCISRVRMHGRKASLEIRPDPSEEEKAILLGSIGAA